MRPGIAPQIFSFPDNLCIIEGLRTEPTNIELATPNLRILINIYMFCSYYMMKNDISEKGLLYIGNTDIPLEKGDPLIISLWPFCLFECSQWDYIRKCIGEFIFSCEPCI